MFSMRRVRLAIPPIVVGAFAGVPLLSGASKDGPEYRASTVCMAPSPIHPHPYVVVHAVDFSGEPLPGAEVRVEAKGGGTRSARTDAAGRIVFSDLAPGRFTIEVSMDGFATARLLDVRAERSCTIAVTAPLEVGGLGGPA